jgi:hypothetical protein
MSHHDAHHAAPKIKPQTAGKYSMWFVIILAGLFIAAINFVNVMGHDAEEGHGPAGHAAEEIHTSQDASHIEATPQENIANDPAKEQSEKADVPHEENAPSKAPSEAKEDHH